MKQKEKMAYKNTKMSKLDEASMTDHSRFWNIVNNISCKSSQCNADQQNICDEITKFSKIPDQDYFDRSFEQEFIEVL